jgi:phthalate 4,5-dioxygenase oxygenase subunit
MLREQGVEPQLANDPAMYRIRSGGVVIPRNADWLEATQQLRTVDREIEEAIQATSGATA